MSEPYIGEIRLFGGNFAPAGWAMCDGQLLAISDYDALFALIGTTYGGDGQTTFALPDLRGRVPVHAGSAPGGGSYVIGQAAGSETVTLTTNQLPAHTHTPLATSGTGTTANPTGAVFAAVSNQAVYVAGSPADVSMTSSSLTSAGGSQPHDNTMPSLAITFIIALYGIFPSQN